MESNFILGLLLAVGNGLVCLLLPAMLSWTQQKRKQMS
jgi:hypothetical protein